MTKQDLRDFMSIDLEKLSIHSAHRHLIDGDFSVRELTDTCLNVIEAKNPEINAYLEVFEQDARAQAEVADRLLKEQGKDAPLLTGIPLAIKDNILIKGHRASAASKMLENYVASYDATAISKLKAAGAVFLGRTNMDEFAMGSSTEHSAFGPTKNPHDPMCVPGGSSGGSAAAVAMGSALGALGSDTGGSVRQPASFCGVVGLKPTYGAVSRSGLIAMGSSLDQIGSFGRTVADTEVLFEAIRGVDRLDATTIPDSLWQSAKRENQTPKVIGVPRAFLEQGIDAEVRRAFDDSLARLESQGFTLRDIELLNAGYALSVYYIIMPAEVSTNLARLDGMRYGLHREGETLLEEYMQSRGAGFGRETRRRILLGTYVLSAGYYDAYYTRATRVRRMIAREFADVFASGVDLIATPTAPTPAFRFGEKTADPLAMYAADLFTVPANIAGIPAISLPAGFADTGSIKLPVGLQLMAPMMREDALFAAGKTFLGEEL
jgi:aspartyl-tRNA(Asn)/glutamyl-tRNA(Gln) amidotransferase subunit A